MSSIAISYTYPITVHLYHTYLKFPACIGIILLQQKHRGISTNLRVRVQKGTFAGNEPFDCCFPLSFSANGSIDMRLELFNASGKGIGSLFHLSSRNILSGVVFASEMGFA